MTRDLHYNYIRILSLLDFLNSVGLPRKRNIRVLVWPAWFENSPHGLKKQRNSSFHVRVELKLITIGCLV